MSFRDCFAREDAPESTVSLEIEYVVDVETDQVVNTGEVEGIIAEALQDAAVHAIAKEHCGRRRLGEPRRLEFATISGDASDVEVLGACEITEASSASCSTFTGMLEVTYTMDDDFSTEEEVVYGSLDLIRDTFDSRNFASATNKQIGEEGSTLIWHRAKITTTKYAGPGIFPPVSNTPVVIGGAQNTAFVAEDKGLTGLGKTMMFFIAFLTLIVLALLYCCCRRRRRTNDTKRSHNTDNHYDSDAESSTWAMSPEASYQRGLAKAGALGLSGSASKAYAAGYRDGYGFSLANDGSKLLSDEEVGKLAAKAGFTGEDAKNYAAGLGVGIGGLASAGGAAGLSRQAQKKVAAVEKKALSKIATIDKKAVNEVKAVYANNYLKFETPTPESTEVHEMTLMLAIPGAAKTSYKNKLPASETAQVSAIEKGAMIAIAKIAKQAGNDSAGIFESDGKTFMRAANARGDASVNTRSVAGNGDDIEMGGASGDGQSGGSAAVGLSGIAAAAGLKSGNERKIKSIESKALKKIAAIDKKAVTDCCTVYLENGMYMENSGQKEVVYGSIPLMLSIPGSADGASELGFSDDEISRVADIETSALEEIRLICEGATSDAEAVLAKEGKSLATVPAVVSAARGDASSAGSSLQSSLASGGFSKIFVTGFRDGEQDGVSDREKIYQKGLERGAALGYNGKQKNAFAAGYRDGYIDISRGGRVPNDRSLKQLGEKLKFSGKSNEAYVVGYKEGARTFILHETSGDKKLYGEYGDLGHVHTKVDVHKCTSAACAACHPLGTPSASPTGEDGEEEPTETRKSSTASKIANVFKGNRTAMPAPGVHFVRLGTRSQETEQRRLVNLGVIANGDGYKAQL